MNVNEGQDTSGKKCSECMYYKDEVYCIRKKQEMADDGYCLHYVSANDRHSLTKIVDEIADYFLSKY